MPCLLPGGLPSPTNRGKTGGNSGAGLGRLRPALSDGCSEGWDAHGEQRSCHLGRPSVAREGLRPRGPTFWLHWPARTVSPPAPPSRSVRVSWGVTEVYEFVLAAGLLGLESASELRDSFVVAEPQTQPPPPWVPGLGADGVAPGQQCVKRERQIREVVQRQIRGGASTETGLVLGASQVAGPPTPVLPLGLA